MKYRRLENYMKRRQNICLFKNYMKGRRQNSVASSKMYGDPQLSYVYNKKKALHLKNIFLQTTHKQNPRQILTEKSHGKFTRQIATSKCNLVRTRDGCQCLHKSVNRQLEIL